MDVIGMTALDGTNLDVTPPSRQFVAEMGALLDQYGYRSKFGIALLHRHWQGEDEILVEMSEGPDQAVIRSFPRSALPDDIVPVVWKLVGDEMEVTQACGVHNAPPVPAVSKSR